MINHLGTEIVARCIPLAVQPATISQNSATNNATVNATNSLKALAGMVLERNKQCNSGAIDTQKPTQLNTLKNAEIVAHQLQGVLTESDKQKILAWLAHIGKTDQEMIDGVIQQVANDAGALGYFLKRAEEVKPTETTIALIQCGNCQHFVSHHAHGKGSGTCNACVQSSGLSWWSDTQHQCEKYDTQGAKYDMNCKLQGNIVSLS